MNELTLPDGATADLPAIAKEAEEAWTKIEQSNLGDRMKSALRRISCGESIRGSAEAEGYSSHSDVYRYAKQFGIVNLKTKAIVDQHRSIAKLATAEVERRLLDDPENAGSTSQLAVVGGISTDKVFAAEKVGKDDGASYLSALEKVAAQFAKSGKALELKVTVGPVTPSADAIDVTAEHTSGGR